MTCCCDGSGCPGCWDPEEAEYMLSRFRDPGGESALHPGKREFRCPSCNAPNALTARDVEAGYQCDACARATELGIDPPWYENEEDADGDAH